MSEPPPAAGVDSERHRPARRERLVLAGALTALALGLWLANAWVTVVRPDRAILGFDSAEYAVAGRHLARTGTLATPFAFPLTVPFLESPPFALVAGHPLLPVLEAALFKLFGEHAWLTLVPVGLAYLATVALAGLLAFETSGAFAVGLLAGVGVALNPQLRDASAHGLSDVPFAMLWLTAILWLARGRPRPGRLGLLVGLAHLTRPVVAPMLPAWIAAVALQAPPGARLSHVARWLAGFTACAASLLLYKWAATGSPWTDVAGSLVLVDLAPEFSKENLPRHLHAPDAGDWMREHPGAVLAKLQRSLPSTAMQGVRLGSWIAGVAFLFHLARRGSRSNLPVRIVLGASLVLLVILASLTVPRLHYLLPLVPAAVALGFSELWCLARPRWASAVPVLVVLSASVAWSGLRPLAGTWRSALAPGARTSVFTEREVRGLGAALAARLPRDAVLVADMAPSVAWYADRIAVSVPMTPAELDELRDRLGVDALVLTNEWMTSLPGNEAWKLALEGRAAPPDWSFGDSLAIGRLRARLLFPDHGSSGSEQDLTNRR